MKSPNLDALYETLDGSLILAQSYTQQPNLTWILKACRMKPYEYVFGAKLKKTMLYRHWFDEYGHSLLIEKKDISIVYNDLSLPYDKIICTDLYSGLSINNVAKMSKLVHLCPGKDQDLNKECFLVSFFGLDNYLRCYLYLYGRWQHVSPLLLGLDSLQILAQHVDAQYFRQLPAPKNVAWPCQSGKAWLSLCPVPESLLEELHKEYEILVSILEAT
jgi:hypothetical protein